jgi:hypothetical protein
MRFINFLLSFFYIANVFTGANIIQTSFNVSLNETAINQNNQNIQDIQINIYTTVQNNLQLYINTINKTVFNNNNYNQLNKTKNIYKINKILNKCTDNIIININVDNYEMSFNQFTIYINYLNLKPLFGNNIDYICSYSLTSINEIDEQNESNNNNNNNNSKYIIIYTFVSLLIVIIFIFIIYKIYKRKRIVYLENSSENI